MLRARFRQSTAGVWTQVVSSQIAGSYRFRTHDVDTPEDARNISRIAQGHFDIQHGPVFSADFFNVTPGSQQLLFLAAHHLVVDLVSWRTIIQHLDDIIGLSSQLSRNKPLPFHSWVKAQQDYSSQHLEPETSLLHDVPPADYQYWGMHDRPNLRGDTNEVRFTINEAETDLLLRGCHRSMKTEALDVLLAAAFFSYSETFSRCPPAIFNEGHGREPWNAQIDITETVGWFTTMFPLHVSTGEGLDLLSAVRLLKDQRRSLPRNGWAYFNSAVSNDAGKTAFKHHWPVEILFNYLGVYQREKQSDNIFQIQPFNDGDAGPQMSRFALIEINAFVLDGITNVTIDYNRNMKHVDTIEKWAASYARTLVSMIGELQAANVTLTPGDFPLLSTTHEALRIFQNEVLPTITSVDNVEDIFACSPMQEGILLGQNRIQGAYNIEMLIEISTVQGAAIDAEKLATAWQAVVCRHATLRTPFVQNLSVRPYDQLVLKNHTARVSVQHDQDDDSLCMLRMSNSLDCTSAEPPHCMSIVHTRSGRTFSLTDHDMEPKRLLHEIELEMPSATKVRNFCQQNNVTLASIFRLAWAKVLKAYTGEEQVCFGYLASGREIPILVGSLEVLQDEYLKSLQFQHIGLAQIQRELKLAGQALFNTVLSYQRRSHVNFSIGDIQIRSLDGLDPTEYDISVNISDSEDGLFVHMNYLTSRLCDNQASNVARSLSNALTSILEAPHANVSSLNLHSVEDTNQIALWNSECTATIDISVHEVFARLAKDSPSATAIDSFEGTMTYSDLDNKSSQLANEIVSIGATIDTLIPIAFEKSPWAIVAIGIIDLVSEVNCIDEDHFSVRKSSLCHVHIRSSIFDHGAKVGCSAATRMYQFSAYTFDACIFEIFTTLTHGGCDNIETWATKVRLMNGYGPTETCVFAVMKRFEEPQDRHDILGTGVGSQIWILILADTTSRSNCAAKELNWALREAVAHMSEEELDAFALVEESKQPLITASEKALGLLWAEVLKIPVSRIGRHDGFFRMGGDSIAAMKLSAKSSPGISLSVSDIFEHAALSDMALAANRNNSIVDDIDNIEPFELVTNGMSDDMLQSLASKCNVSVEQIADAYPCTALQESLMVLSMVQSGAYVARKAFKLPATIDVAQFRTAWERTILSNPILRTTIVQLHSGRALQVVLEHNVPWRSAATLQQYMEDDTADEMEFGKPLSRYAITADGHFIWTAHHSIYDGWSVPLILEQVRSYYQADSAPTTPGFNTFVKYLSTLNSAESGAYWERYLAEGKPATFPEPLPATRLIQVDQIEKRSITISRPTGSDIPMATILRAAWAFVLARHSDACDVVFGMTMSGRNCPLRDIGMILGPTITTVPVRVLVPTDGTVYGFLEAVQQQAAEMIPFEHFGLQNIANISEDMAQAVKFQNLLVIQPRAQFDADHDEILGAEQISAPLTNFDTYPLVTECRLSKMEVQLEARFDMTIISREQTERLLRNFEQALHSFNGATPGTMMEEISMIAAADLANIMTWNETYPAALDTTVPDVFAQQVKLRPDVLAVDAWDGTFTYAELDVLSATFARHLVKEMGVGPEVLVPLCFEKSRWAIVTQLSVMKAGGAIVNLDPAHPSTRLEHILQDARATILLVSAPLYEKFKGVHGLDPIAIDESFYRRLESRQEFILPEIDPSSAAYVLFTSGSTGRPKGIVVEHRNLCSSSHAHGEAWDIGPNTRLLQFAAYTFDVSCADIFTTIQRGGCICVPSDDDRLNNLSGAINRFRCNWAFLTPTVASLLPAQGIPSLRKLILGGEASTRDTVAKWHRVLNLIICYGPAECSIYCSGTPPATEMSDPGDLGQPLGALYWVVDASDHNRLAPVGCTGELLLEGPTVARGYLHDAEKTAQAFVHNPAFIRDPVWADPGTADRPRRFYRTGDLVRLNKDGSIHFVGRKDTQVKVRGQRVELGEIEHAIRARMPNLSHVTVDAVSLQCLDMKQMVVAFLHIGGDGHCPDEVHPLNENFRVDLRKLQVSLAEALPSQMLPNLFIPLAHVPLTANGKADRRWLRDMVTGLSREQVLEYGLESSEKQTPKTAMEFSLRDLWSRALSIEPGSIGVGDHFFRIGGDSIIAMQIVGMASENKIPLSVRDFFSHPTLTDMATALEGRDNVVPRGPSEYEPFSLIDEPRMKAVRNMATQIKTSESNIADILPATDFQTTAVAHALMRTRGLRNYLWLDGTGDLDISTAEKALGVFVAGNEILRTVFAPHEDTMFQVVLKEIPYHVECHLISTDLAAFTDGICRMDMALPTRISDPLLKFIIIKGPDRRHRIMLRLSHAQYDGLSLPMLWDSLAATLEGRLNTRLTRPMSAYMHAVASLNRDEALDYWRTLLQGSSMTTLVSRSKPSYGNVYDTYVRRTISRPSVEKHGTTFATVLKAAWSLVLAGRTSTRDVTFGHVVSGRALEGVSAVAGACINVVPVRVKLASPDLSVSELLRAVHGQHGAGLPYEAAVGSRTIVRQCAPAWPPHTRFSSIVQHQNIEETNRTTVGGVDYEVGFFCPQADEADVAIKTTPLNDGTMDLLLICSSKGVGRAMGESLADLLCDSIREICARPESSVEALLEELPFSSMTEKERHDNGRHASAGAKRYFVERKNGNVNGHANWHAAKRLTNGRLPRHNLLANAVAAKWTEVLRLPTEAAAKLDDDSDFFEAGGDLVSAALLSAKFQIEDMGALEVESIIDGSRLGEMVEALGRRAEQCHDSSADCA
ncbi:hypothetical protein RJ55_07725 [Drechmeria coniospora]|nr:hypothetical protein RJ55_07725 [Drechmeria coniospora]